MLNYAHPLTSTLNTPRPKTFPVGGSYQRQLAAATHLKDGGARLSVRLSGPAVAVVTAGT